MRIEDWVESRLRSREVHVKRALVAIGILFLVVQWVSIIITPLGDFRNHWGWALRFRRREFLYAGGSNIPYLPFWAMAHAPLTLVPAHLAQILCYPAGVLAGVALFAILGRITARSLPIDRRQAFWPVALTLALTITFVAGDLIDCGQTLFLTLLLWSAVYSWTHQRPSLGGMLLGLAIALKLTGALFVPYLCFRREWRAAAVSLLTAALLTVAPALWQGPELYRLHVETWSRAVWAGVANPDPRIGVLGLESVRNMSLRPALARYLTHIPEGDPDPGGEGRFVHPLNVDVLTLAPGTASWIIRTVTVGLLVSVGWALGPGRLPIESPLVPWEAAAVGILMLLISPITWRNHCVAIIPACYLLLRFGMVRGRLPGLARLALASLAVTSLVFSRTLMGKTVGLLVHAYYLQTWVFVLLLAAIVVTSAYVNQVSSRAWGSTAFRAS